MIEKKHEMLTSMSIICLLIALMPCHFPHTLPIWPIQFYVHLTWPKLLNSDPFRKIFQYSNAVSHWLGANHMEMYCFQVQPAHPNNFNEHQYIGSSLVLKNIDMKLIPSPSLKQCSSINPCEDSIYCKFKGNVTKYLFFGMWNIVIIFAHGETS